MQVEWFEWVLYKPFAGKKKVPKCKCLTWKVKAICFSRGVPDSRLTQKMTDFEI